MDVRRFHADTAREALRMVRQSLGSDAFILSSRDTADGVEIMAVGADELQGVAAAAASSEPPAVATEQAAAASPPPPTDESDPASPPRLEPLSADQRLVEAISPSYELAHEVRVLRSLMEGQLAAFAYNDLKRRDACKTDLLRRLLAAGFSATLSRGLIADVPDGLDPVKALRLAREQVQRRLPVAGGPVSLAERGGVFALVGPTGVGKTTTVAKLAAECVLRQGASALALVTTDTYRIGAVDQLRIYGKILNVPVFAIRDEADLRRTLDELCARHLVLIDTVGMSQRDRRLADQVALLAGGGDGVRRILLLSAVSQASALDDVVRAYRGADLDGCILTKVDEALTLGGALDVLIRHQLPLHYVTNGQRVPEDLHRPNPLYLVERAVRAPSDPLEPDEADLPLLLAVSGQR